MNIGTLYATLWVDATPLEKATMQVNTFVTKTEAKLAVLQKNFAEVGGSMKTFGRSMTQFVTLPMALVGGAAFKMYKDFEYSMTKIISLVGVARSQVEEWSEEILQLAPKVGKSPAELAEALFFITSAGLRGAEAMEILESSAKGSATGLGSVKEVADLVTSAVNAYGKANLSASEAADVLTATVREGKVESDALAGTMGLVLPIASAMSAQFWEVGAATAAMTRTGTKAATAAIQLRQIFNSIAKPAKEAEKALTGWGKQSEKLRRLIKEEGLLAALEELDEITKTYGVDALGKVIPNIRSLTGILDIMGKNVEANKKIFDSIKNAVGDAEVAFAEVSQTVEFRWQQALASARVALVALGKEISAAVLPLLEGFRAKIEKLISWFQDLDERQKQLIIRMGALVTVIGPVITILGFLVGNVLPGLIAMVRGATVAFAALNTAMFANPVIFFAAALALVARKLWKVARHAEKVRTELSLLEKVDKRAAKSMSHRKAAIAELTRIILDEERATRTRTAALDKLKRISDKYYGNLKLEKGIVEGLTTANEKYIESLVLIERAKELKKELFRLQEELDAQVKEGGAVHINFWGIVNAGILNALGGFDLLQDAIYGLDFKDLMEDQNRFAGAMTYFANLAVKQIKEAESEIKSGIKTIQDVIDEVIKENKDILEELFGTGEPDPVEELEERLITAMQNVRDAMQFGGIMSGLGIGFDLMEHKISTLESGIETLAKLKVDPSGLLSEENMTRISNQLNDWTIQLITLQTALKATELTTDEWMDAFMDLTTKDIFTELDREIDKESQKLDDLFEDFLAPYKLKKSIDADLALLDALAKELGDLGIEFDLAGNKYDLFLQALEQAIPLGDEDLLNEIRKALAKLKEEIDATDPFGELLEGMENVFRSGSRLLGALTDKYRIEMNNQIAMAEEHAKAHHKSEQWLAKEIERIHTSLGKKLQKWAVAEARISGAVAIMNAWRQAKSKWEAVLMTGLITAATEIQVSNINAQKFGKGGIVPPGYPSDTYPALLTSGETVLPPDNLTDRQVNIILSGNLEVDMHTLRVALEQATELHNATT